MPQTSIPTLLKGPEAFGRLTADQVRETHAYTLGVQAVLWRLQWVKAAEAFHMFSAPLPAGRDRSPYDPLPHAINVWGHARTLLNADTRLIETPNTETLYSIIVVDLDDGPVVIEHPDFGDRYFRTTVWDVHSDTHTISQKQDGSRPPPHLITRAGWTGDVPAGMKTIEVRSRYFQFAPHIAVYSEDDLPKVHALQDRLRVTRLADWSCPGSGATLKEGRAMTPLRRPATMAPDALILFEELCETLKDITVRDDEIGFARQLGAIGITLTDGFQIERLDAPTVAGLTRAVLDGQTLAAHKARDLSPAQPGGTWTFSSDLTSLDNWLMRAGVGFGYVWGDLASEVLYPTVRVDAAGQALSGANRYVLQFAPGRLPPARYWRISMYDIEGFFFNNPINRYGIGNMAETLRPDAERRADDPHPARVARRGHGCQWLPAPAEGFFMVMRLYQPEERMYQGTYILPPVTKV